MSINKPDTICTKVFDIAKSYFNRSIFCKIMVYVVGVTSLFIKDKYSIIPMVAMLLVIMSEYLQYKSDTYKGIAESLRRKLDFMHSFGWSIPIKDLSNVLLELPPNIEKQIIAAPEENYFMSNGEIGVVKSLENLEESSWWSKHLTETAFNINLGVIAVVAVLLVVAFYTSLNVSPDQQDLPKISKILTSSIMVLFTVGLVRTTIGYSRFHKKSEQIDTSIPDKLKSSTLGVPDCVKLWSEYHVARAASPLIPTIIWKLRRDRLNALRSAQLTK